jgi:hypothetical protein
MHPLAVAADLRDLGDAVALHLVNALVAIALRSEGHNQARHQGVAGARQRPKHRPVGVVRYQLDDPLIENVDLSAQRRQHRQQAVGDQHTAFLHRLVLRGEGGLLDG